MSKNISEIMKARFIKYRNLRKKINKINRKIGK